MTCEQTSSPTREFLGSLTFRLALSQHDLKCVVFWSDPGSLLSKICGLRIPPGLLSYNRLVPTNINSRLRGASGWSCRYVSQRIFLLNLKSLWVSDFSAIFVRSLSPTCTLHASTDLTTFIASTSNRSSHFKLLCYNLGLAAVLASPFTARLAALLQTSANNRTRPPRHARPLTTSKGASLDPRPKLTQMGRL